MKKLFFSLLCAVCAVVVNAQTTIEWCTQWNVLEYYNKYYW